MVTPSDVLESFLFWLRGIPWRERFPTVSNAELLVLPFVAFAWFFRWWTILDMWAFLRKLRTDGSDDDLGASARDRLYRSLRAVVRIGCWVVIVWALLTNYEFTAVVFTLGLLANIITEAVDGALVVKYQIDRKRYWERRDALDDYAERVALVAAEEARGARAAAEAAAAQGHLLLAAVQENTAMTERAAHASESAERVSNHINDKLVRQGESAAEDRTALRAGIAGMAAYDPTRANDEAEMLQHRQDHIDERAERDARRAHAQDALDALDAMEDRAREETPPA